jgi:serine/threonine-protein kinase
VAFEREEALLHGVYEITEVLGIGGFGIVLAGRHRDIGQLVAIKTIDAARLPPSLRADLPARLRVEARLMTTLRHPHIVEVYNYETDGELHLLVMERLDGTLGGYFGVAGGRTVFDACAAGVAIGAALGVAHARNIVHRDIKPQNVLVASDRTLKVADFGIAKVLDDQTHSVTNIATPVYAPPEQLDGAAITPAADVYALGVTLYEILTGRPPFGGGLAELRRAHRDDPPPPLAGRAAGPIAEVVLRALRKDPTERYQDGRQFAVALFAAAAGQYGADWPGRSALPLYIDEQLRAQRTLPILDTDALLHGPSTITTERGESTRVGGYPGPDDAPPRSLTARGPEDGPGSGGATLSEASTMLSRPDVVPPPVIRQPPPRRRRLGRVARTSEPVEEPLPVSQPVSQPVPLPVSQPVALPVPLPLPPAAPPATRFVALLADGRHVGLDDAAQGPLGPRSAGRRRLTPVPIAVPGAHGIAVGPDRALYVSAPSRHLVVRVEPGSVPTPVLGTGEAGFAGEAGSARRSRIDTPYGLAFGPDGALYVADSGNGLIRRVDVGTDLLDTVAGATARALTPGGRHFMASGAEPAGWTVLPPSELVLRGPRAVAFDADGRLLVADTGNHRVLRVTLTEPAADPYPGLGVGEARLLAGTGQPADSGDGGPAVRARLKRPAGILALPDGRVLVADTDNGRVRAVSPTGQITALAGGRYQAPSGLSGPATRLRAPTWLVALPDGSVLVADTPAGRVAALPLGSTGPVGTTTSPPAGTDRPWPSPSGPTALAVWPGSGLLLATGAAASQITVLLPDGQTAVLATLPR